MQDDPPRESDEPMPSVEYGAKDPALSPGVMHAVVQAVENTDKVLERILIDLDGYRMRLEDMHHHGALLNVLQACRDIVGAHLKGCSLYHSILSLVS